ncbi:MAG: MIP/aquaporin family protein [Actinomycetota bacterium]|nr:MIP/aquaporin family protein [Actinomycetota bacterium]
MIHGLSKRAVGEFIGTAMLVAAVVGSGIMGTLLSENLALTLLINAVATVAALGVLIWAIGPISGAHFNPVVTAVALARREMPLGEGGIYIGAQVLGALAGVALANVMFDLPAFEASTHVRTGMPIWLGEVVATAGLLLVIGALTRTGRGHLGAVLVPAWIGSAYFFTSSTSFANPAVTIGRSLTDTFSGIAPSSVALFIVFQIIGAIIGAGLTEFFYPRRGIPEPLDLPDPIHHGPNAQA